MVDSSVGPTRHIWLLVNRAPGDPVILDASELSVAVLWQERAQVIQVEVEANISIEIPISRVSGIAFLGAPDLFAGFSVSAKNRWAGLSKAGSVDCIPRTRRTEHQAVSVQNKPSQFCRLQHLVQALMVGAFRQPDSFGCAAE